MKINFLTFRLPAVALLASLAGCGQTTVTTNSNGGAQTVAAGQTPPTAAAAQNTAATPAAPSPAPAQVGGGAAAAADSGKTPNRPATARDPNAPKPQIGSGGNDFYTFTQARAAIAADEELKSSSVAIAISGGVATLTGSVAGDSQKQKAERLVSSVPGVTGVKNQLRVSAAAAPKP